MAGDPDSVQYHTGQQVKLLIPGDTGVASAWRRDDQVNDVCVTVDEMEPP